MANVPNRTHVQSALDQAVGIHLKKVLGEQSLSAQAANARHAQKLEQAAELIGVIERFPARLGAVASLKVRDAFRLYEYLFPNPDEREPLEDIKARLKDYPTGAKDNGGGFFATGIADKEGHVVGYTQGSTVPSDQGLFFYWQYGGVADTKFMQDNYGVDSNPREHGVLNVIHALNSATLEAAAKKAGQPSLGSIWESEPRGLGSTVGEIEFTDLRLSIHNRAGGQVMMGKDADGQLINLHLQPRLTEDSEPIALHMMVRPAVYEEGDELNPKSMRKDDASAMLMAWVNNFRVEGFAEADVADAEGVIQERLQRCESIVLLPAKDVPDLITLAESDPILEQQVRDTYGVSSLAEGRQYYEGATALASLVRQCGQVVKHTADERLVRRFDELAETVRASSEPADWPQFRTQIQQLLSEAQA